MVLPARGPSGITGAVNDSAVFLVHGDTLGCAQVLQRGRLQVHANFLVNVGGATASDFLTLARKVKDTVHRHYGVVLQEEVRIIDG